MALDPLPAFDDLPLLADLGLRHAWGVFGEDDVLGTVNLLTAERVAEAAALVRTGETISLDLPLDQPDPPLFGRKPFRHEVFALSRNEMDDRLDNFHLQASTQWDALSHIRCREFGFWGGRTENPSSSGNDLGIDRWAEYGIAGRGVLLDVAGHLGDLDPFSPTELPVDVLLGTARSQGVALRTGDVLCIRTGWVGAYRALDPRGRAALAEAGRFCGLRPDEAMARFLWDSHVAALCCDNPAVEPVPGDPAVGSLHRRVLPLLGLALGEMFDFEALADRCRASGRWAFFFVAAPLKVPGGVGSPGNAVAIL
ncbi:MAG: cyclase family protein [Acidimicrobiia bacterium]|nr:cyclase family protein [Acidimicrobiia bacterium]